MNQDKPDDLNKEKFKMIIDIYQGLIDSYTKANGNKLTKIMFFENVIGGFRSLKHYLEDPEEKEITWDNPIVELQYMVEMDWNNLNIVMPVNPKELEDTDKMCGILTENFIKSRDIAFFRLLCNDVAYLKEGDKLTPLFPQTTIEKLEKLPEEDQEKEVDKLLKGKINQFQTIKYFDQDQNKEIETEVKIPFTFPFTITVTNTEDTNNEIKEGKYPGSFFISFNPLVIDKENKRAYFPIEVGIETELKLSLLAKENRETILDNFFNYLEKICPKQKFPKRDLLSSESPYFAMPADPLMFSLLALFAGKPERIPRWLLDKPYNERTQEEKEEADKFLDSILTVTPQVTYESNGSQTTREIAIISDNPIVKASAEIDTSLFGDIYSFHEETLSFYINKTYGPEGLRHLIGLLIGLEENSRKGYFHFNVNEHLERLGLKREKSGSYKLEAKKTACMIVKIFSSLLITTIKKDGDKKTIEGEKLFSIDGFKQDLSKNEIINESIKLRATDFWYKNAIEPKDGQSPKFIKLLKKIARENHLNHPITIYLTPILTIFWRMNPERKLSIESLMNRCHLDFKTSNTHRMRDLKDLESELNYMKEKGYLGDWTVDGENILPSNTTNPFKCVITLTPPDWLKNELKTIEDKKKGYLPEGKPQNPPMTRDEFDRLFKTTNLSMRTFANNLGVSPPMISYILSGKRKISPTLDAKIRKTFGDFLPL